MFLIKDNETTFTIWWKFVGSIVVFSVAIVAVASGTLYIPGKGGFFKESSDGDMFWLLVVFCFVLSALSFWQGSYGIFQKYFVEKDDS